ncbi:outer membrane protein transport protein [Kistimonas scapharcae]|uniref:Outer membrane protein transport protein n=1 Tax=Kistimonas scapharcae TaxID=1036133 RepID=A0ABP8V5B6_9GAMM
MSRTPRFTRTSLSVAVLAALPMLANAAGFQVNEHSAAGLGRAFAGEAAIADDASVIARNAAGMSLLDSQVFTAAVSYIKPEVDVELEGRGTAKNVADEAVVPTFYYVRPIDERWTVGIGGFSNFGLATHYGNASGITPAADETELTTYNLNPSVAYRVNDDLSVGFGVNFVYADATLTSSSATPIPGFLPNGGDISKLTGDDWGYGWNAGILWQATDATRVGLSYRSEVKLKLEGKVSTDTVMPWNSKGSVDLTLPSIAELSVHHQLNDKLAVHASAVHTGWSSFDELATDLDNGQNFPTVKEEWKESWRYAVGMTYQYNDQWTWRTGIAKDNSPVRNEHRTFRIPDADRIWVSVGGSYKLDKAQSVDFGYAYLQGKKVDIDEDFMGSSMKAEVKSADVHILSLQYNYRF